MGVQLEAANSVWGMGVGYPMVGMGMAPMTPVMSDMGLGPHMSHSHNYAVPLGMGMMAHDSNMMAAAQMLNSEHIMNDTTTQIITLPSGSPAMSQGSKEIVHCKSCTLFPPNPNAPPPTTRERPPGCRTIFVGGNKYENNSISVKCNIHFVPGLPENMTEGIIQEIFERCGEITTLRLSKKNFCHIRFVLEGSVDAAIYLSGYRVRIGSNGDTANTGRLHVDFAQVGEFVL